MIKKNCHDFCYYAFGANLDNFPCYFWDINKYLLPLQTIRKLGKRQRWLYGKN